MNTFAYFVSYNARSIAFALFAAGISVWTAHHYTLIENSRDWIAVSFITFFGLFLFLGLTLKRIVDDFSFRKSEKERQSQAPKRSERI